MICYLPSRAENACLVAFFPQRRLVLRLLRPCAPAAPRGICAIVRAAAAPRGCCASCARLLLSAAVARFRTRLLLPAAVARLRERLPLPAAVTRSHARLLHLAAAACSSARRLCLALRPLLARARVRERRCSDDSSGLTRDSSER